jgi:hypothetical protein
LRRPGNEIDWGLCGDWGVGLENRYFVDRMLLSLLFPLVPKGGYLRFLICSLRLEERWQRGLLCVKMALNTASKMETLQPVKE